MTDMFEQTEVGIWLPKDKLIQVTALWVRDVGQIKVLETYDVVKRAIDTLPATFTDLFNEPVYITDKADIVALTVMFEDEEALQLDLKERELSKKMKSQQLAQAALQAATPIHGGNRKRLH